MLKVPPFLQKKTYLIFLLIIIIGVFFRTYALVERFDFAHDGDLSAWIVKDILVNHHPRLIGQLTSAPGIFIGGFYYYGLVPFFLITNLDPIGGTILATILGILTTISFYWVFSKLFNTQVGLISAFLQAVLLYLVNSDRTVLPTAPVYLWSVWYFYCVFSISRKNYSVLPLLAVLIALIWHIHIALVPTLLAVPVAIYFSKKLPTLKQVIVFLVILVIISAPLIIFETRHNFQQTFSLIENFRTSHGGETGLKKLTSLVDMLSKNTNRLFLEPQSLGYPLKYLFFLLILVSLILVTFKKIIKKNELIVLLSWIVGVILFFTFSSTIVSEYYIANIEVILIFSVSASLALLLKSSLGKILIIALLSLVLVKNLFYFIPDKIYHKGYLEKKQIVATIEKDSQEKNYPCLAITYITSPGENTGFRYLMWLNNFHLNHPGANLPTYNIVIPDEYVKNEINVKYGHIGLIYPHQNYSKEDLDKNCQAVNTNLTDSLFGYVE